MKRKPIGIALIALGVLCLIWGSDASASLGSQFSRMFTGAPTNRTIWLLAAGIVSTAAGLGLLFVPRRSPPR
jgi:uncharacterized protein YjeT (DUF2065 family)